MEEETIAKKNMRDSSEQSSDNSSAKKTEDASDTTNSTDTESSETSSTEGGPGSGEMGGPMGGGPSGMTTTQTSSSNEWLVPMTATGIVSGVIILATAAICLAIWKWGGSKQPTKKKD